jgi:hypothetical protein
MFRQPVLRRISPLQMTFLERLNIFDLCTAGRHEVNPKQLSFWRVVAFMNR